MELAQPPPTTAPDPAWREACPVLAAEAQTLGAVGVIRSLGRAGYPVHACSSKANALGARSRYASVSVVCPPDDSPGFVGWLRDYVRAHGIRAIVPSEGMLLALRPAFVEFAPLLPFSQRPDIVYSGMSKYDVHQALVRGGAADHLPPTLACDSAAPPPGLDAVQALGSPLYLKVDGCYGRDGGRVHRVPSAEAAVTLLEDLRRRYDKVLIQGHVPGRGVGAFFLWWGGRLRAEFMHRRLHEVPHDGGVSSLRESVSLPAIRDDALAKLRCLEWEGIAMMEYRWDEASGQYYFMELNGRFWGSLHLALFAGVDFPALLVDAFFGHHPAGTPRASLGVRCRQTIPGEAQYVWSRFNDRRLSLGAKAWSALEFVLLSLDPRVYSDLLFPGDRTLYCRGVAQYGRELLRSIGKRFGLGKGDTK